MFEKFKKTYHCEFCNKEVSGFFGKTKFDGKICCFECNKIKVAEAEAAIPSVLPPKKFKIGVMDTSVKNEIVFWITSKKPVRFHMFFYIKKYNNGCIEKMEFLGVDRCSGKPAIVSVEDDPDYPTEIKVDFLSQTQFKDFLSQYPAEVREKFEGFSADNWRDYLTVTQPLCLGDSAAMIFREINGVVELLYFGDLAKIKYIKTSKAEFEKWRDERSILWQMRYFDRLKQNSIFEISYIFYDSKTFTQKDVCNKIYLNEDVVTTGFNCIVMYDNSKKFFTKKLLPEDIEWLYNGAKRYFGNFCSFPCDF